MSPGDGPALEFRLLGRFAAWRTGTEIPAAAFGGRLVRSLVRVLLTRRGAFVSKDLLTEALWPSRAPADPSANLDVLVSRARRALGDPGLVTAGSGGYSFCGDEACCRVDAERFLAEAASGAAASEDGNPVLALRAFQSALDLWQGEPLAEDRYADWAQEYRRALGRAHLDVLEGAATAALAAGMPVRAVALAERAVTLEPLREAGHLLLARALAGSGDAAGALAAIAALRQSLADELGLDLPPAAAELELAILRGASPGAPAGSPAEPARSNRIPPPSEAAQPLVFVGRDAELARLLTAFGGLPLPVGLVSGHSGSGKTRLLAELRARLPSPVLAVRAFRPESDEAWSLARSVLLEALALDLSAARALSSRTAQALVSLVPGIAESVADARATAALPEALIDPESARALAREGFLEILAGLGPGGAVIVIDDLQWADPTSLSLLGALVVRQPDIGLLAAYRPEDVLRASPAAAFLDDLAASGRSPLTLQLGPLPATAVADRVADDRIARSIAAHGELTPFTLAEVVRTLTEEGALTEGRGGRWVARGGRGSAVADEAARRGHRQALAARIRWQPPARRAVLSVLALMSRESPAGLVAAALGTDPLEELDALARAGLVCAGEQGWATAHDLVADAAAEALEPGERMRLHQAIAAALGGAAAEPGERAHHLAAAGDRPAAAEAYLEAAGLALRRHAMAEAAGLADAGLGVRPDRAVSAGLLASRAEARTNLGMLAEARQDLQSAVAHSDTAAQRSVLLTRLALLTSGTNDLQRAADLVDQAMAAAGPDRAARAQALYAGAIIDMNGGRPSAAAGRFAEALDLFEALGDGAGVADILDARAMAALLAGRVREGAEALGRAANLFLDSGQLLRAIWPLASRGAALGWELRGKEGLADIAAAMDLARAMHHEEAESCCLLEQALTLVTLDRAPEAVACAGDALALAERLGHTEWTVASLLALGSAHAAATALIPAEAALRRAADLARQGHLGHFLAWSMGELASVLIARGDDAAVAEAAALIADAKGEGTGFAQYYVRLARTRLAHRLGDPEAPALVAGRSSWPSRGATCTTPGSCAGSRRSMARRGDRAGARGRASQPTRGRRTVSAPTRLHRLVAAPAVCDRPGRRNGSGPSTGLVASDPVGTGVRPSTVHRDRRPAG
ncbi:MAG TPA: BTAD domain-containing putative transcriptional regulator [Actinomycetota bacterium]|nr:BTAD domain-containing putative transcriptional regulator [Actinomycetota bacterium]